MKFRITILIAALTVLVFILCEVSFFYYLIPILIGLVFLIFGVKNIQWNYFLKAYHKLKKSENTIALTFDDGPHPEFTPLVLDLLKENQIKAAFFCIGKNIEKYPELVNRIINEGHIIGNHSYSHSRFIDFKLSRGWRKEIEKTDEVISIVTGNKTNLFRPPYGVTTPHLALALKETPHKTIGWSVRSYDTVEESAEKTIRRVESQLQAGDIVLLHDTHSQIIPILAGIISFVQSKKYTFVSLSQLLIISEYDET